MTDPGFPQRPNHPDFWRLSMIIRSMDRAMDEAADESAKEAVWQGFVAEAEVDRSSIVYLAMQRAMRALDIRSRADLLRSPDQLAKMTALYVEGFIVGSKYAREDRS